MEQHTGKEYYGQINLQSANNSHTQSFLFLEEHCKSHGLTDPRVLEIGCNTGYFTKLLKDHGYFVHGVEFYSDAAAKAGYTDDFFHGTVEEFIATAAAAVQGSFDAVILGDVLEHLLYPEEVLRGLARCLKPNGVLILSVPNVTHVGVRQMLLDGQWQYSKSGIMDTSHLRFYTRHSLRKLLVKVGFGIERSYHVLASIYSTYAPGLLSVPDSGVYNEQDHTLQIIVRASRTALKNSAFTEPPRNIALISRAPHIPCFQLRLERPLCSYCDAVGGTLRIGPGCSQEDLLWADLIVMQRAPSPAMLQAVRDARALGISVVYDMDDLVYELPGFLTAHTDIHTSKMIGHLIANADITTCSTPRLREEVAKFTETTALVPNCMHNPGQIDVENAQPDAPCTFVLASSDTVQSDWLRYPLHRLLNKYKDSSLVIVGKIGQTWQDSNFPATYYPLLSPDEFSKLLLSLRNGIGIIPLDTSEFSSCKSAIKFYHYSLCGLVTAASKVPPYTDEMEHGETGLLVENNPQEWFAALDSLAANPGRRRLMLAKALRWCQKNSGPERAVEAWKQAFHLLPRPDEYLRAQLRSSMN